ncbi:uncharacterized protein TRUGW13939_04852 [Talaromyces rugulosus]|uniref:Uncharacterized protein n=1 Tax=Talaromyces rugulosus TaxID=121627 RepID=A0A7H8QY98_TALRU|nr:uncharacterized protein TRUGW13939_04852 [Talaromyces rugulosus]QKX57733.1 hypothetical protein TRUGW13939_04852 [Talaromyces rugulosus]
MPFSYWPGGIPSYIKFDQVPIVYDKIKELTTGWQLFVKEKWIPKPADEADGEYEGNQRRALVSEWAQAPQSLRDEFQSRALASPPAWSKSDWKQYVPEGDESDIAWFTCIAPLDTPRNRALWTKLRILSYDFYWSNDGICEAGVLQASPHLATAGVEPNDFMKTAFVENASFSSMSMTVHGTVVFNCGCTQHVFADQRSLEDGMLLIVNTESNGEVVLKMRSYFLDLLDMYCMYFGLGKGLEEKRGNAGFDGANSDVEEGEFGQPFDISKPILEIFADVKAMGGLDADPDKWPAMIEQNAPGYLALEAEGKGDEYDHSLFSDKMW